jgi:hypothetical protein
VFHTGRASLFSALLAIVGVSAAAQGQVWVVSPNTSIWFLLGGNPTDRFLPRGPLLIDAPRVVFAGTTDASGVLHSTQAMPLMAPAIEYGRLFLQSFYLDPRGRFVLSAASMLVALDETF